jgi:hypothetical protein
LSSKLASHFQGYFSASQVLNLELVPFSRLVPGGWSLNNGYGNSGGLIGSEVTDKASSF